MLRRQSRPPYECMVIRRLRSAEPPAPRLYNSPCTVAYRKNHDRLEDKCGPPQSGARGNRAARDNFPGPLPLSSKGLNAMTTFIRTLAAFAVGTVLATSAFAENAR